MTGSAVEHLLSGPHGRQTQQGIGGQRAKNNRWSRPRHDTAPRIPQRPVHSHRNTPACARVIKRFASPFRALVHADVPLSACWNPPKSSRSTSLPTRTPMKCQGWPTSEKVGHPCVSFRPYSLRHRCFRGTPDTPRAAWCRQLGCRPQTPESSQGQSAYTCPARGSPAPGCQE